MHASVVFFPPSYLWTQPRSESDCMRLADPICVVHKQAMDVPGPSAISVPRPMRMPEFDPTSSGPRHSGSLEPHSLLLQRGPKRIRDLWTAAHLPQMAMDSSQASPLLVTMSYILPEFQYYRHATECHGSGRILCSTSSHLSGALFTQSQMIIIECFLIIDTKRCPAP